MRDTDFDDWALRRKLYVLRRRSLQILGVVFVAVLGACLFGFVGGSPHIYTCAACRADKVDQSCLGFKWSDHAESELTHWYTENVEPFHTHTWVKRGFCRRFGIPGLYSGYACYIGAPITGLSQAVQRQIYEHFEDRLEAKRLFIRLGQMDGDCGRIWQALMDWVDADYPGTWQEWWEAVNAL